MLPNREMGLVATGLLLRQLRRLKPEFQQPAISEIRSARPLRGHHRGPQRRLRRASGAERRTLRRLLHPLQNQSADALRRFMPLHLSDVENQLGVKLAKLSPQSPAAGSVFPDSPPLSVAYL